MKKIFSLLLVVFAFIIYLKNGEIIKAEKISIGQNGSILSATVLDERRLFEKKIYIPMNEIIKIEDIK